MGGVNWGESNGAASEVAVSEGMVSNPCSRSAKRAAVSLVVCAIETEGLRPESTEGRCFGLGMILLLSIEEAELKEFRGLDLLTLPISDVTGEVLVLVLVAEGRWEANTAKDDLNGESDRNDAFPPESAVFLAFNLGI